MANRRVAIVVLVVLAVAVVGCGRKGKLEENMEKIADHYGVLTRADASPDEVRDAAQQIAILFRDAANEAPPKDSGSRDDFRLLMEGAAKQAEVVAAAAMAGKPHAEAARGMGPSCGSCHARFRE